MHMSAPLIYMKIHHNRLKPAPLNAHPHLIQPLPHTGLASLSYLTEMNCPFARSDISTNTPPTAKIASTVIGLFSIAFGAHILQNGISSFNPAHNCFPSPQQDVQCLKTGNKSPHFKTTAFKPLRIAGPVIVIRSTTTSFNPPLEAVTSVQKAFLPRRSVQQADLVQSSFSVQRAVTLNREAIYPVLEEVTASQKAVSPVFPVKLIKNLTLKVPTQGEGQSKMTKNLGLRTSSTKVVSNVQSHPYKGSGKENKQERRTAKSRKKFNRRRRIQPRAARNEVEENKSTATGLASEDQNLAEKAPETLNGCIGSLGDNSQTGEPCVERKLRRDPRKPRTKGRKNATRRSQEVKDGASTPQTSPLHPPRDANELINDAKNGEEGVPSKRQACVDHEESREATIKPRKGRKNRKHQRAKQTNEKVPNQIGEQNQHLAQASATGSETQQGPSEAQEKAAAPLPFLPGQAVNPDQALYAPQTERLNSPDRRREVRKSPRFSSQDVRNDVNPGHVLKKHWKPQRGQMK